MPAIHGLPEWAPEHALLERRLVEQLRGSFESHGFVPLDTGCITTREELHTGGAQFSDGGLAKPIFSLRIPVCTYLLPFTLPSLMTSFVQLFNYIITVCAPAASSP